jgi:hypothetical protein
MLSFLDVKDDVMFEVDRSLEIEYLYRHVYFPNIWRDHDDIVNVNHKPFPIYLESQVQVPPASHENLAATDVSQRILSILSTERTGILLETFYIKLSDLNRHLVEEQVSLLTLEGLVYTNQGKLNLL